MLKRLLFVAMVGALSSRNGVTQAVSKNTGLGDWFVSTGKETLTLTLPQKDGVAKKLSIYDFEFEGAPVTTDKLHLKQLSPGVFEVTSVAYTVGEWRMRVRDDASYYGLGERFDTLNHAHTMVRNVSQDNPGAKGSSTDKPVPFFMSTTGYGLWFDTVGDATFDMNAGDKTDVVIDGVAEKLRVVLFTGPEFSKILDEFTALGGRAPLPPYRVFAPWLGRGSDRSAAHQNSAPPRDDADKARLPGPPASGRQASFSPENGLATVVMAELNAGLSGMPLGTSDPGGHLEDVTPDAKLFMRWTEYAAFSPTMEVNSAANLLPWKYGDEALAVYRRFSTLHRSLFPYIYAAAQQAAKTGMPIMRALVLDYQDNEQAREARNEYMFGPDLLVAPVVDEGTQRTVYLPSGDWVDYWTGTEIAGGKVIVADAAIDSLPLYVKRGALLPKLPDDVMTRVPETESGKNTIKSMDDRRVYEVVGTAASSPATMVDFEGRTVVRSGNSLTITGNAKAHVIVRWRFRKVQSVQVDSVKVVIDSDAAGEFVQFDYADQSTIAWQ